MTKTNVLKFAPKTTYEQHLNVMRQLRKAYLDGHATKAQVYVMFLDHLEATTGIRPYDMPFPYKTSYEQNKAA